MKIPESPFFLDPYNLFSGLYLTVIFPWFDVAVIFAAKFIHRNACSLDTFTQSKFWNHLKICNPHLFSLLLYRYDLINCKSRHKTINTLLNTFWLHPDLYISTDVMLWRKLYFCGLQRCKIIPTIKPRTGTVEPHLPFLWETIKLCYT